MLVPVRPSLLMVKAQRVEQLVLGNVWVNTAPAHQR